MEQEDESITTLGADPQIHDRLAKTLTPKHVTRTAGKAIALQLASIGPTLEANAHRLGLHVGYTAVAPLSTASLFRHVRDQCGDVVVALGCEAATRTHLVESSDHPESGPLINTDVRLTACDAIAQADADFRETLVRAILSNDVAIATAGQYTTKPLATVVAVGQTLPTADREPFDSVIASCLDCIVPVELSQKHIPTDDPNVSTPEVAPIPASLLGPYLEAVWATSPTVTAEARAQWNAYRTDQKPEGIPTWMHVGSPNSAETVPKLAAALARLQLTETITTTHTTTAIEWFESVTARPTVTDHAVTDSSCADR